MRRNWSAPKLCRSLRFSFFLGLVSFPMAAQSPFPPPTVAPASTIRQMETDVGIQILRYRAQAGLPELKLFHTSDLQGLCRSFRRNYIQVGVHDFGGNPIRGTASAYLFDSAGPQAATEQLKEIANEERPHGKNGKLAIDDAHRLSVEICTVDSPPRYRVVVGYWYSKLGVLLDSIPRGKE